MSSATEIMTSPKAATFPKRTRRPKPIGAAGVVPVDSVQPESWHSETVPLVARGQPGLSPPPPAPSWPLESCGDLLSALGVLWRVARDAPAWGHRAGRGTHLDGAGRQRSRLPPALRRPGLATWEPAPRGLAATLSWERRPQRHHEEVLLRWAPHPAWGGSVTGTCASHPSAGGQSGRGPQGTKWVR